MPVITDRLRWLCLLAIVLLAPVILAEMCLAAQASGLPTNRESSPLTLDKGTQAALADAQISATSTASPATPIPGCTPGYSIVASPNPGTRQNFLQAVSALTPNDVWAVGYEQGAQSGDQTLVEHWDGSSWSVIPSPNPQPQLVYLTGVVAIAPGDVWAVGYYLGHGGYQTLTEHWDGNIWNIVPSPNSGSYDLLTGVSASSPDDVWAVGFSSESPTQGTLVEHWDGASWSIIASPGVGTTPNQLQAVSALSANDVWAVGNSGQARTLIEHWSDGQWSIVPSPNGNGFDNHLVSVSAIAPDDVWAVGNYFNGGITVDTLIEHWDGVTWSIVPSPNARAGSATSRLQGVSAIASNDVWAVGYYLTADFIYKTLIEHWDGRGWSITAGPDDNSPPGTLVGVSGDTSTDVWTVGNYYNNQMVQTLVEHYGGPCGIPTPLVCNMRFRDIPPDNTFYPYVRCLACRGIISGYACGANIPVGGPEPCDSENTPYFRPNNPITRGQIAKMLSNAAGLRDDPGPQIFQDVTSGNPFYQWINRLANKGYISGYPCGGAGEPCVPPSNSPYFRPISNTSRGQIAKLASNAAGFSDDPGPQIFEDIPPNSPFYAWIGRLASRGIMAGYPCGDPGERCAPPANRPYFRSSNSASRGQTSKVVSGAFFPNCSP